MVARVSGVHVRAEKRKLLFSSGRKNWFDRDYRLLFEMIEMTLQHSDRRKKLAVENVSKFMKK